MSWCCGELHYVCQLYRPQCEHCKQRRRMARGGVRGPDLTRVERRWQLVRPVLACACTPLPHAPPHKTCTSISTVW
jgi:hypothetical protein